MTPETLMAAVNELFDNREQYIHNMENSEQSDSIGKIMELIVQNSK